MFHRLLCHLKGDHIRIWQPVWMTIWRRTIFQPVPCAILIFHWKLICMRFNSNHTLATETPTYFYTSLLCFSKSSSKMRCVDTPNSKLYPRWKDAQLHIDWYMSSLVYYQGQVSDGFGGKCTTLIQNDFEWKLKQTFWLAMNFGLVSLQT